MENKYYKLKTDRIDFELAYYLWQECGQTVMAIKDDNDEHSDFWIFDGKNKSADIPSATIRWKWFKIKPIM